MTAAPTAGRAEPFFLKAGLGERFCVYRAPQGACRGAFLYVHPFGDEMNKARRMAALQARELAAMGYAVLQLDLYGCGDSSGDFSAARWEIWKEDLALGSAWLRQRSGKPVGLWGLRLGALLALDYARGALERPPCILLWQPVYSGATFLTQFLRTRMANQMLAANSEKSTGTKALRDMLRAGEVLEVSGYGLDPAMADAIEALDVAELAAVGCPVHWFEVISAAGRQSSPAAARAIAAWTERGVDLRVHLVPCLPFWATQEIAECPTLLSMTSSIFSDGRP